MPKVSLYGAGKGFGFQMAGIRFGTEKLTEWSAKRGAEIARGYFDTNGPNGSWAPIHEFTKRRLGSNLDIVEVGGLRFLRGPGGGEKRTLVDTGGLRDSIQAMQIGLRTWAVVATDPKAPMHEYGVEIEVSEKMRGWLSARGLSLKDDTECIVIPQRRFMRPAADQLERELDKKTLLSEMASWLVPMSGVERLI